MDENVIPLQPLPPFVVLTWKCPYCGAQLSFPQFVHDGEVNAKAIVNVGVAHLADHDAGEMKRRS